MSEDLAKWKHIKVDIEKYPIFHLYAPGACVLVDKMYLVFFESGIISSENPDDPNSWTDVSVDPNEMHIHYTIYGKCGTVVGCPMNGVKYFLTVDSFN